NKIITLTLIFTLTTSYTLLHRPLGLAIFWVYDTLWSEQNHNLRELQLNIADKETFLRLVSQYDLIDKMESHEKEIRNYIKHFEFDLLIVNALGIEDWYYQPLLDKMRYYALENEFYKAHMLYNNLPYTQEEANKDLDFLKACDNVFYFFDKISKDYKEYENYMFQAKLVEFMLIYAPIGFVGGFVEIYFPEKPKICNFFRGIVKEDILQRVENISKSLQTLKEKDAITAEKVHELINPLNSIKEKLNECK
ncbi:hypothetical protein CQA53_10640, partial [Helicobacter didelphidarum]